jgi:hypothetical protein
MDVPSSSPRLESASYTGLVFGATVMIWAFGPGLLFLFLREQGYRRPPPTGGEA